MDNRKKLKGSHTKRDVEKQLYDITLKKWSINKTWMKKWEFQEFITRKLFLEQHQDPLIYQLQNYVGDLHGKRMLDIGCGEGGLVVALNLRGFNAVGVDLNEKNIQISMLRARKHGLRGSIFKKGDARALPFDNDSFAVLTFISVLEHIGSTREILHEASRVLKKDGYLFATVPNKYWPIEYHVNLWFIHWLPLCIRKVLLDLLRKQKGKDLNYLEGIKYYSPGQWHKFLSSYFFKIHDVNKHTFENLLLSMRNTKKRSKALGAIKFIVLRASNCSPLRRLLFYFYKFLQPQVYLLAQK